MGIAVTDYCIVVRPQQCSALLCSSLLSVEQAGVSLSPIILHALSATMITSGLLHMHHPSTCFLWQCIQAFFFFLLSLLQAMGKRLCHHRIMKLSIRHFGETGTFSKVVIYINYRTDSCFWESQPNSTMFPRFQSLTLFLAISLFLFQTSNWGSQAWDWSRHRQLLLDKQRNILSVCRNLRSRFIDQDTMGVVPLTSLQFWGNPIGQSSACSMRSPGFLSSKSL